MKSGIKLLVFLLFLNIASSRVAYGKTELEIFNEANKFYMDESYEKAAESYEQLISMKKVSAEIYFNLGNAYYKSGNTASAILNYERALRLKPSDPDIQYNLKIANLNSRGICKN
ncbi:MAG TPA: tetratricopeptide repeat protein, partial [Bacteroidia bacterium]|nr:tetratricopeptide repeat protein [Bacteroidia bacterium]